MMSHQEYFQIQAMQLFGELGGKHGTHKDGAALLLAFQQMVENFKSASQQANS
ncbi:hypothetical protein [Planctobacterium marinum]|uniref:hypothetical protein n=1 Tax=Planctobacterium marinum TaxID=1631968 RepID=UPI001E3712E8|nr:hypothetical protein [Planctobacterium marinum]MCC2604917.1 hypothetical protein [Planctobacterium marinum]